MVAIHSGRSGQRSARLRTGRTGRYSVDRGPLLVACPACGAPAGHSCRPLKVRPDWRVGDPIATHRQRRDAAKGDRHV